MKLSLLVFSLALNLMAMGEFSYLVVKRGGLSAMWRKTGLSAQVGHSSPAVPGRDGFLQLVEQLPDYSIELFSVDGSAAFLILPRHLSQVPIAWVWDAPIQLPKYPDQTNAWLYSRLLDRGIAVAGIDIGVSYGSPEGTLKCNLFYERLMKRGGLASQVCLMPQSVGGLILYNWAARHPNHVKCIAGIYPVCDLRNYPGLAVASSSFKMTQRELGLVLEKYNPIGELAPLAQAHIPIFHLHGNKDKLVFLKANSEELIRRYQEIGGEAELQIVPNEGHVRSDRFYKNEEFVNWIVRHCGQSS
jgi:hypothetical protein